MNGAQSLIRTLVDSGVTACFANPGTSEMHFVKALDDVPAAPLSLPEPQPASTSAATTPATTAARIRQLCHV